VHRISRKTVVIRPPDMHEFHRKRCDAGYSSLPFEKDRYPQPDWKEVLKQGIGTIYHN
jgi:hypothetical protein